MLRKVLAWALALAMLAGCALAQPLERADARLDTRALERCWSWTVSESGDFKVISNAAANVVEQFEAQIKFGNAGLMCMALELRGNLRTNLYYPVLKILYNGRARLNCGAVSVAIGDTRYDFAASSAERAGGRGFTEEISVYLDDDGLDMARALIEADEAAVCLFGAEHYAAYLKRMPEYTQVKPKIESGSLDAFALPDGAPDFERYALSDLAFSAYISARGKDPRAQKYPVSAESPIPTDDVFGLVGVDSAAAQIREVQELLLERDFMSGALTGNVTDAMRVAVRRAQRYYGLIESGYADARLINLLTDDSEYALQEPESAPREWDAEAENARYRLDRWWYADRADTSVPGTLAKNPADADNTLILADGWAQSLSGSAMSLSFEAEGVFTYEGKYDFPAQLYSENNSGASFTSTLGALASVRLIAFAEIPKYVAEADGEWKLKLTIAGETREYELK